MITWADVTAIAPELSSVAAGTQAAILASVVVLLDPVVLGVNFNSAAAYLAAHLATLGTQQAAVGGLAGGIVPSSATVGPLTQTYTAVGGTSAMARSALETTAYGRMYLMLSAVPRVMLGLVT